MKMMIVLAALVALAIAAPVEEPQAVLVKETPLENIGTDGYQFGYELSNGETREESAVLKNAGTEDEAMVITGSFSWVDQATGEKYTVNFVADENGFHPEGAHIPA